MRPAFPVRPAGRSAAARGLGVCLAAVLLLALAGCTARNTALEDAPLPFRQAEDSFRLGDYDRAVRGYEAFVDSESSEDYDDLIPRAYYRMALAEFRRGRYAECLAVLDRMERRLPDREWPQVSELRGDAEQARGNTISAIHWWEQAWNAAEGDEKRSSRQRIADALARMDPGARARARSVLTTPELQALVDVRPGPPPPPTPAPAAPARPGAAATTAPDLTELDAGPSAAPVRIGCLLPLTGSYAAYGQRSLNAVKLAFGAQAGQLVVRDTKGEVQVARAAFDELAADPSAVAVIGPLRSKVAETIAPRAERAGIPLVVLSQQEGISGRWVVQPAMTYERQAAELAEYAAGVLALRRFGVLYPNDPYGIGLAQAFRAQIERRQGQIVGTVMYEPGQSEFSIETLAVDKWISGDALQAVFIPDFAATAVPLAQRLRDRYPELVLLGSSGWNDAAALAPAASDLEGAVFVDGFFVASQRPATQRFVAAYRSAYRTAPDILEAQAYDAATLVAEAIQGGARTRAQLGAALQGPRQLDGAGGALAIGPHGVQRELFLLRIQSGTITELAPGAAAALKVPLPRGEVR